MASNSGETNLFFTKVALALIFQLRLLFSIIAAPTDTSTPLLVTHAFWVYPTVGYTQKAWVTNKGVEVSVGAAIIEKSNLSWNISANATFVKNKFVSPELEAIPFLKNTGGLHGQGSSGAYSEAIANGQPLDVFYLPPFQGFDKTTGV